MYDPDSNDFAAALASAKADPKPAPADTQTGAEDSYMRRFASGDFAREVTYGMGQPRRAQHGAVLSFAVTAEDFRRHAQRFGPELVTETARAFSSGEAVTVPRSTAKRQRRTSESFREQVLGLHRRGVLPAAIADSLNVSDRRVKEVLRAA